QFRAAVTWGAFGQHGCNGNGNGWSTAQSRSRRSNNKGEKGSSNNAKSRLFFLDRSERLLSSLDLVFPRLTVTGPMLASPRQEFRTLVKTASVRSSVICGSSAGS